MQEQFVLERERLRDLLRLLADQGYQIIGPRLERGTVVYGPLPDVAELPAGFVDEQSGGHYRLKRIAEDDPDAQALFRYTVGPHSWKRYLFPPQQHLWRAVRENDGFRIQVDTEPPPRYAFFGVRACELAAMAIQDRVFDNGEFADRGYGARREQAFLVAVDCCRAGDTCFCASTRSGPTAREGFDLCLTELLDQDGHRFLVRAASERGEQVLSALTHRPATDGEVRSAARLLDKAAGSMGRHLHPNAAAILARSVEHPRWQTVAQRCLGCANCTLVCPTCFCSTVQDQTSLDGAEAVRLRQWDSCFSLEYSYIHGGPVRREAATRYRQWITHKLSTWYQQFGTGGCTGCGRCITWCPVGIDITEEVAAIQASETTQIEGEV